MLRIGFLLCLCCLPAWPQPSLDSLVASAERYENEGKWEDAAETYRQIIRIDPGSIAALNRLGAIRVRQGRYRQGIALYERAYKVNPRELATNLTDIGLSEIRVHRDDEGHDRAIEGRRPE